MPSPTGTFRRNVVLIDFESVQPDSVEVLNQDHFQVLLFCGANQTRVPFAIAATLQKLGSRAQYIKISGVGPNALDFHIAYYIGRIAAEEPGAFFHIISRDKGFDPLIEHLKSQKIFALRWASIPEMPIIKNESKKSAAERAEAFITKLKTPNVTRPRTDKTMGRAIISYFQPAVNAAEAADILKAIVATGFISIENGKINYAQPAA